MIFLAYFFVFLYQETLHHGQEKEQKILLLIGDSTMKRTAIALAHNLLQCSKIREQDRCDFAKYFGIQYENRTAAQIPVGSGPLHYGKRNRGCQDCSSCASTTWSCADGLELQYLGIEFAKDVIYRTENFKTTQESIILGYIPRILTRISLCIFNTGLHDLALGASKRAKSISSASAQFYENNLNFYTSVLLQTFSPDRLYWIATTSVKEKKIPNKYKMITNNRNIQLFNEIATSIMDQNMIKIYDAFTLSQEDKYQFLSQDGVHLGAPEELFYTTIGEIFLLLMKASMPLK